MKTRSIALLCAVGSFAFSSNPAQAALASNAILDFSGAGSFFSIVAAPTTITSGPDGGLVIGLTQTATGSHSGLPDGSESATIDAPWGFLGNTGMHSSTGPVSIVNDDGAGNVTLDFADWGITWNSIANIPLGGDPDNFPGDTGIASLTCGATCGNGDSFVLAYSAHVPIGDGNGFDGAFYELHLEGTVSAVPIPAALWLFGSGLVGFASLAKRRRS